MADNIIFKNNHLTVSDYPIIPFIEGDGVGYDIWKNAQEVFDVAINKAYKGQKKVKWVELLAGKKAYDITGEWLPQKTLEFIKESLVAIKGPLETPVGGGIRSLNVALRQELDLYACVRPVRYFNGINSPVKEPEKTDIIIFRENTEDLYAGIEWDAGTAEAKKVIDFLQKEMNITNIRFPKTSSIGIKPISKEGSERLIKSAIEYAMANHLKKVTLVHKGNIQKFTEGGFRTWGYHLAERDYAAALSSGALVIDDIIADNFLQQILIHPEKFEVVALTNLNGDYASDALAAQVGGIGISPGANINYDTGHAIFEATHGTAPDIAGKDIANPCSLILSGCMLFDYLGWTDVKSLITTAIEKTFEQGIYTADLAQKTKSYSTSAFTEKIIDNMLKA